MQQQPLYHARGDLTAGEIKAVREPTSVTGRLEVSSWHGLCPALVDTASIKVPCSLHVGTQAVLEVCTYMSRLSRSKSA